MAVMNDEQRKAYSKKVALRYPRTFKQKVAQLLLKLPFVTWATKVDKEYNYTTIIQIFEGDGETAKSWELKNQKCHDDYSRLQSSSNDLCPDEKSSPFDLSLYSKADQKRGVQ